MSDEYHGDDSERSLETVMFPSCSVMFSGALPFRGATHGPYEASFKRPSERSLQGEICLEPIGMIETKRSIQPMQNCRAALYCLLEFMGVCSNAPMSWRAACLIAFEYCAIEAVVALAPIWSGQSVEADQAQSLGGIAHLSWRVGQLGNNIIAARFPAQPIAGWR